MPNTTNAEQLEADWAKLEALRTAFRKAIEELGDMKILYARPLSSSELSKVECFGGIDACERFLTLSSLGGKLRSASAADPVCAWVGGLVELIHNIVDPLAR